MDFDTYAAMGVDLVSSEPDDFDEDQLASVEGLRRFLASRPWLAERVADDDLEPLRVLRRELREVFVAARSDDPDRSARIVERLNQLLLRYRPQPSISGHDDQTWHLHVAEADESVATDYATGAVMGFTMAFLDWGPERFGTCAHPGCRGVFLDTSRNRSRRFCSDRCATRANVAAYRSRRRAAGAGRSSPGTDRGEGGSS